MKVFAKKLVLLVVIVFILIMCTNGVLIKFFLPQYLYGYDAAIIDKTERLESIRAPKIILVGNSNLAFGIDSELIEDELGMPVVNMGLHGSLGNEFQERMALGNITAGDIVVICHSNFDKYDRIVDAVLVWTTIENHFDLWKCVPIKEYGRMFIAFPAYINKAYGLYQSGGGNEIKNGPYSRGAFNGYGDNAWDRPDENSVDYSKDEQISDVGESFVNRINKLNMDLKKKGAYLLMAGYPICLGEATPEIKEYEELETELRKRLCCPLVSSYTDYMIDYKYFYDGTPHLNNEGAQIRTIQLIEDLRNWMKEDYHGS